MKTLGYIAELTNKDAFRDARRHDIVWKSVHSLYMNGTKPFFDAPCYHSSTHILLLDDFIDDCSLLDFHDVTYKHKCHKRTLRSVSREEDSCW